LTAVKNVRFFRALNSRRKFICAGLPPQDIPQNIPLLNQAELLIWKDSAAYYEYAAQNFESFLP
jgi:hypothetical protein